MTAKLVLATLTVAIATEQGETDMSKAFMGFIVAIAVLWTSNAIAQTAERRSSWSMRHYPNR